MTELPPSPLDAYETAKPDEPTFTLQGGDPVGAPLVRLWAHLARVRGGRVSSESDYIYQAFLAARQNNVEHDEDETNKLLLRACHAEQISWQMDEYRKSGTNFIQQEKERLDEFERLDLYDIRRRCASAISNFFCELGDYREQLQKHEYLADELDTEIQASIKKLRAIHDQIVVRRGK